MLFKIQILPKNYIHFPRYFIALLVVCSKKKKKNYPIYYTDTCRINTSSKIFSYLMSNFAETSGLIFTKYGSIVVVFTSEFIVFNSFSKHSIIPTHKAKCCKRNMMCTSIIIMIKIKLYNEYYDL